MEFAQAIADVGGKYQSKIAALESKVSELQSSNQALELELAQTKSRVLAADRHAPSVAKGVSQSTSSEPAVGAGIIAVGSRLDKNNYVEEMATWARNPQQLLPKAVCCCRPMWPKRDQGGGGGRVHNISAGGLFTNTVSVLILFTFEIS